METSYKPHAYSRTITLPSLPPGVSLAPVGGQSGLQQWFRGLSSTPVSHYTSEALEFCQKRWETKWSYYRQTQEEQHMISTMGKQELLAHARHLESELTRLQTRFTEMDMSKASAEMTCGVQFMLSLIESQNEGLFRLKAAEMDSVAEPLEVLKNEVKLIDQAYQFVTQGLDTISRLHMLQILEMRNQTMDPDLESAHSTSVHSELEEQKTGSDFDRASTSVQANPAPVPGPSRIVSSDREATQNGVVMNGKGILQQEPNWFSYPPNTNGAVPEAQGAAPVPAPVPAVTQALSTAASHRATLLSLSAISFFGAGMAWATVFSGTRGDLVLISWAASCFIVATASAACGTSLLDADGTLVERFLPVRWTVRLLSLCATLHVFAGIMLISAAILILDPNMETPQRGIGGNGFSIVAERVAGAYSLVVCGVVAISAFAVRRRYSRRTWFMI
ncbi:transmembrane protein, putative [Rhizoctonia solani AG-3 Rhs1AP]|uniref:Transmembrane protein, putative n=1 Tax=Rhizoctonia solani AG-3 Rhs1AP TaxID=1086054 RepID=X8J6N9_9AGAM|nr:transmembrane protein, putative [Rhizoctonia solani AG-3 Rhs1AP]